jgi:hypothetical protein
MKIQDTTDLNRKKETYLPRGALNKQAATPAMAALAFSKLGARKPD